MSSAGSAGCPCTCMLCLLSFEPQPGDTGGGGQPSKVEVQGESINEHSFLIVPVLTE
jgi:hypothetical protein